MYAFIVNPNSRSGLGLKIWEQLELILKERHIDYQIYFTRRPGHGTKLAAQICDTDADTLVVLGGDGTIGEVVNGIRDLTKLTLAYIPIGSGNDFARSMKLTKDPTKALLHILNPTDYAYINVGLLKTPQIERRYAVSSGIGFDADVCYHNNLSSKLKHFLNKCKLGKLSYTAIALHLLLTSNPKSMRITLMAHLLDGKVATAPVSEYGKTEVEVDTASKLFTGVSPKTICWILLSCLA